MVIPLVGMILASKFFLPTKKPEQISSADLKKAHKFMLRSGMISQLGAGLYFWLPLGKLVLDKIASIVHKHAKKMGFNDCLCTNLHPSELWKEIKLPTPVVKLLAIIWSAPTPV